MIGGLLMELLIRSRSKLEGRTGRRGSIASLVSDGPDTYKLLARSTMLHYVYEMFAI